MSNELLPINFKSFSVDTSKMSMDDYDKLLEKELEQFKYDVTLSNMHRAKADKTFLNKLVKNLEDQRKEYFKPYEDLKKELIKREKTVKTLSDKLRDDAKALEETIVIEEPVKQEYTHTEVFEFTGTDKFFMELEKLAMKHNAICKIVKQEKKGEGEWVL